MLLLTDSVFASLRVYAISNKNALVGLGVLVIGVVPAVINLVRHDELSIGHESGG